MRIKIFILLLFLLIVLVLQHATAFADPCFCGAGGSSSGSGGATKESMSVGGESGGGGSSGGRNNGNLPSYNPANFAPNNTIRYEADGHTVCYGDCTGGSHRGGGPTIVTFYICDNIIVTSASVSCGHTTDWKLTSTATWPAIPVDVRPYPATLNRWPTVLRVDSLPTSSASASLAYAAMGGGSSTNPAIGDWRNIVLTNTIYPDPGVLPQVYLQNIGWVTPPIGELYTFTWPLPSHPAAGAKSTAGAVGQLQELPQDMPLYTNQARAAYLAECTLTYQQYTKVCVKGPGPDGQTGCDNNTGHMVGEWVNQSMTEQDPVSRAQVPASMEWDVNGVPVAYSDPGVEVNRMNDANSISDPVYGHSYSWGDIFYWAVREGQGQITFP